MRQGKIGDCFCLAAMRGEFSVPVTELITFFGGFAFQQSPR